MLPMLPPSAITAYQGHIDHILHEQHVAHEQYVAAEAAQKVAAKLAAERPAKPYAAKHRAPGTPATPATPSTVHVPVGSGFQACVISRESGGDPRAVNPSSGAGGLYQFLPSTWAGLGYSGLPEDAPVSEQTQAFWKLYNESGTSPWVSDGCAG